MEKYNLTETCIEQELIFEGKVIRVQKDTVSLPNGQKATREVVRHPGAVAIIAKLGGKVLMVRQYRYALGQETLEIPAGKIDPGEKPENCAVRELREETGYMGDMTFVGAFNTSPGFADEIIYLYEARNLIWSPLSPDEDEFLNVHLIPWEDALRMTYAGELQDAKTALGILLVQGRS